VKCRKEESFIAFQKRKVSKFVLFSLLQLTRGPFFSVPSRRLDRFKDGGGSVQIVSFVLIFLVAPGFYAQIVPAVVDIL
jgi:hypothetical protein